MAGIAKSNTATANNKVVSNNSAESVLDLSFSTDTTSLQELIESELAMRDNISNTSPIHNNINTNNVCTSSSSSSIIKTITTVIDDDINSVNTVSNAITNTNNAMNLPLVRNNTHDTSPSSKFDEIFRETFTEESDIETFTNTPEILSPQLTSSTEFLDMSYSMKFEKLTQSETYKDKVIVNNKIQDPITCSIQQENNRENDEIDSLNQNKEIIRLKNNIKSSLVQQNNGGIIKNIIKEVKHVTIIEPNEEGIKNELNESERNKNELNEKERIKNELNEIERNKNELNENELNNSIITNGSNDYEEINFDHVDHVKMKNSYNEKYHSGISGIEPIYSNEPVYSNDKIYNQNQSQSVESDIESAEYEEINKYNSSQTNLFIENEIYHLNRNIKEELNENNIIPPAAFGMNSNTSAANGMNSKTTSATGMNSKTSAATGMNSKTSSATGMNSTAVMNGIIKNMEENIKSDNNIIKNKPIQPIDAIQNELNNCYENMEINNENTIKQQNNDPFESLQFEPVLNEPIAATNYDVVMNLTQEQKQMNGIGELNNEITNHIYGNTASQQHQQADGVYENFNGITDEDNIAQNENKVEGEVNETSIVEVAEFDEFDPTITSNNIVKTIPKFTTPAPIAKTIPQNNIEETTKTFKVKTNNKLIDEINTNKIQNNPQIVGVSSKTNVIEQNIVQIQKNKFNEPPVNQFMEQKNKFNESQTNQYMEQKNKFNEPPSNQYMEQKNKFNEPPSNQYMEQKNKFNEPPPAMFIPKNQFMEQKNKFNESPAMLTPKNQYVEPTNQLEFESWTTPDQVPNDEDVKIEIIEKKDVIVEPNTKEVSNESYETSEKKTAKKKKNGVTEEITVTTTKVKKSKKSKKSDEKENNHISVKSSFSKFDELSRKALASSMTDVPRTLQNGGSTSDVTSTGTSSSAPPAICKSCGKTVFVMEQIKAEKQIWHKNCFRCKECNKQLTLDIYSSHEGVLYCKPHFRELFKPKAVVENEDPEPTSDKPDLGLEELSSLNVKSRYQVFEKTGTEDDEKTSPQGPINVKRSPSILSKLAKFQNKANGNGLGVSDENLNGSHYEESETSSEDEDDENGDASVEKIIKNRKKRERPLSFSKMGDVRKTFENGPMSKEERLEERKLEKQNLRSRLFMGKQGRMKEMYEQAVADSEKGVKREIDDIQLNDKARNMKEKFERGDVNGEEGGEENNKNKSAIEEDLGVFEAGISKKSRSLFLEMDANMAKSNQTSPSSLPSPRSPRIDESRRSSKDVVRQVSSEDIVRSSDRVEDVQVETSDISSKFKFFETYKPAETQRKRFRMTPPREDQTKDTSPDREVFRDPNIIRSDDPPMDDEIAVVKSATASKMLSLFRQMEEESAKEVIPDGPKPLKSFTPPPDYKGHTGDTESEPDESDDDDEEEEEEEESGEDDGIIRASDKVEDEFLKQAANAARAKTLKAKFEHWEPEKQSANNAINMLESEQASLDSTKSLRARFESMNADQTKEKPRPKVNRFV